MDDNFEYTLAKSAAGHDKGSWYAIINRESGFVYIADGRRRKLLTPKKKNIKHVEITRKTVKLDYFTDKSLRKALWDYNFGGLPGEDGGKVDN
jgi:ribosomal protein L14E/L6E/L27E